MSNYKSAREVINETDVNQIGLALLYIETERQMFFHMRNEDEVEVARAEGFMKGIITTSKMLGITDLYGKTITNLRFAIQEENKEYKEKGKEQEKE